MNKKNLVAKLKQLDGLTPEERAELVNLLNTKKKYGLIWEDKPEDVEEQLRTKLPILREVVEKRLLSDKTTSPNHILIEGDNLHALTSLTFTHENKIDVIYIDPPYNTGNKDFKYNDSYVDKEDGYRHSKWLSFIYKRLEIAKRLLSDNGVIFISIDDNEHSQLTMLCDEVFEERNRIANICVVNNLKGRSDEKYIATAHEYVLIYKKAIFETLGIPAPDEYIEEYKLIDLNGKYRLLGLRKRGDNSKREDRPNLFYPIYYDIDRNYWSLDENEFINPIIIFPKLSDGTEGNWRWGRETLINRKNEIVIQKVRKRNEFDVFQKDYLIKIEDEIKKIKPKSFWSGTEFSTDSGTKALKEIIPTAEFRSPKPLGLLNLCLLQSAKKQSIILDFFAGSGTTLQATMQLNAADGGNRQCILVTNNENNICEEVTYERNKRVIQGYINAKSVQVEGLTNNNLRYYRSEYVGRDHTHKNKKELVLAATELLCIKEDIYTELAELNGQKLDNKVVRCFSDKGKYMLVIYDEEAIETLLPLISAIDSHHKIKIYIFAPGQYPFTEEFEDVLDKVELCALPDAIYKAYANVLPKKKAKPTVVDSDEESAESETSESAEPNLFTEK